MKKPGANIRKSRHLRNFLSDFAFGRQLILEMNAYEPDGNQTMKWIAARWQNTAKLSLLYRVHTATSLAAEAAGGG